MPSIDPLSVSLIVDVSTLVLLWAVLPNTKAESESIFKLAFVDGAIIPGVGAPAFRLAVGVDPFVAIAVVEEFDAFAMFISVFDVSVVLRES